MSELAREKERGRGEEEERERRREREREREKRTVDDKCKTEMKSRASIKSIRDMLVKCIFVRHEPRA